MSRLENAVIIVNYLEHDDTAQSISQKTGMSYNQIKPALEWMVGQGFVDRFKPQGVNECNKKSPWRYTLGKHMTKSLVLRNILPDDDIPIGTLGFMSRDVFQYAERVAAL